MAYEALDFYDIDSLLTDEERMVRDMVRDWVEDRVIPNIEEACRDGVFPDEWRIEIGEMGILGAPLKGYGCPGLSYIAYGLICQELERGDSGVRSFASVQGSLAMYPIWDFGSEEQKEKYLPRMAKGELVGCFGLTEPDYGSNPGDMITRAEDSGDRFILNGAKMWITNGLHGSLYAVLTKTDLNASPAHKGMTMFLAQRGEGFNVDGKIRKLGYRGLESVALSFDDFKISADRILGGKEGFGFKHAVGGLELGRINVAARGVGVAKAAMDDAVSYSQQRKTFGKPICDHQSIQIKLADMATKVEAARLLVEQAAAKYDRGERCDMEAGMAKLFASEAALENATEAMRVHGGYGYSKEFDVERYYRDAPLMCIGEGTNEIQRVLIARQLIQRNPV